jgi:hypothetical protein
MKLKLVTAAALLVVTPALAQPLPPPGGPQQRMAPPPAMAPQQQQAPKPTEAQLQKVVQAVSADKAKLDAYCRLANIQAQMATLDEKKDARKLQALGQQADAEAQKIGPDFERVMDGLEQVDENSAEGKKFAAILGSLDSKCPKQQAQPLPPPGGPQRMAPPPGPAPQPQQAQPLPPPGGPQRMAPPPAAAAAPPQQQQAPKPTEAQLQKVVQTVSADKAKTDSYCKVMKLQQQMATLDQKKDAKKLQALGQQADAEAQKLGPEFGQVMDGLEQVDENTAEGKRFAAILASLDSKCK